MFFLDIGYSHVFWTYQGLELSFSKTAGELLGENCLLKCSRRVFFWICEKMKVCQSRRRVIGLWYLGNQRQKYQPAGRMLLVIKNESRIRGEGWFALLLAELENWINFNFRKRSLLFFTLFSRVRVLLLSNFAYLVAGINYNIFVYQLADCKSDPLQWINCSHFAGVNKLTSRNVAKLALKNTKMLATTLQLARLFQKLIKCHVYRKIPRKRG